MMKEFLKPFAPNSSSSTKRSFRSYQRGRHFSPKSFSCSESKNIWRVNIALMVLTQLQYISIVWRTNYSNPLRQLLTLRPKDRSTAIKEGDIFHQSHSDAQSKNVWRGNIALMVNPDFRYKQKCMYLAFFVAEVDQNVTQADHACEVAEFWFQCK